MRLATYQRSGSEQPRVGVVRGEEILDLHDLHLTAPPERLLDLIRQGKLHQVRQAAAVATVTGTPLGQVRLCAPIPQPDANVICLGRNYAEHARETARARQEEVKRPTFFTKAVTTINGPYDDLTYDASVSTQIDWEAELGVVIGRPASGVSREEALEYVFGYMVLNDVSARDLQHDFGGQYFYGKSLNGYCPTGPWIVTADEIPDPQTLTLRLRVNGETKQQSNTSDMIVNVAETIAMLSRVMTLQPGQILATGTPAGVGFGRNPPEFLGPGDVMETEVVQIGTMRNQVVEGKL